MVAWYVCECAAGLSIVRFHDVPLCERMLVIRHPIVLVWCSASTVAHHMVDVCPRFSAIAKYVFPFRRQWRRVSEHGNSNKPTGVSLS